MTTPNVYATGCQWVESLAQFTFSIKYQIGCDNAATDTLSHVTLKLNAETKKSILDGVTMGTMDKADAHDLAVAKADEDMYKPV